MDCLSAGLSLFRVHTGPSWPLSLYLSPFLLPPWILWASSKSLGWASFRDLMGLHAATETAIPQPWSMPSGASRPSLVSFIPPVLPHSDFSPTCHTYKTLLLASLRSLTPPQKKEKEKKNFCLSQAPTDHCAGPLPKYLASWSLWTLSFLPSFCASP